MNGIISRPAARLFLRGIQEPLFCQYPPLLTRPFVSTLYGVPLQELGRLLRTAHQSRRLTAVGGQAAPLETFARGSGNLGSGDTARYLPCRVPPIALPGHDRSLPMADLIERLQKPLPHLFPAPWRPHLPCRALAATYNAGNDSKRRGRPVSLKSTMDLSNVAGLSVKAHRFMRRGQNFFMPPPHSKRPISSGTRQKCPPRNIAAAGPAAVLGIGANAHRKPLSAVRGCIQLTPTPSLQLD